MSNYSDYKKIFMNCLLVSYILFYLMLPPRNGRSLVMVRVVRMLLVMLLMMAIVVVVMGDIK